jgi:hypothetical protein
LGLGLRSGLALALTQANPGKLWMARTREKGGRRRCGGRSGWQRGEIVGAGRGAVRTQPSAQMSHLVPYGWLRKSSGAM